MVRLIISPPGTGKTSYIINKLKEAASSETPMLIVPEQSHFETERTVYKTLGARIFCKTEILTFTKLVAKITAENKTDKPYADDAVREITMLKTINELWDEHGFDNRFGTRRHAAAAAARMLNVVGTFGREGISPEQLLKAAEEIKNPRLQAKIRNTALIFDGYIKSLPEGFSDRVDEIRTAARLAFSTEYFRDKNIFIDGFDGFTGGQTLLLEAAIKQAACLTIALTADKPDTSNPKYLITANLTRKLKNIAEKNRIEFITELPEPYIPERNPKENAEAYIFPDIYTESNFVAAKIRELITEKNYSQNEIAVLNAPSAGALESAFSAYGLKLFSDMPKSVIEKPMVRFIITVLEAVERKLVYKSETDPILNLIESGFLRVRADSILTREIKVGGFLKITGKRTYDYVRYNRKTRRLAKSDIRLLSRTAREQRLEYEDWYQPFPQSFIKKSKSNEKAEKIRAEITDKLSALSEKIKNASGEKITEELAAFIINDMELGRTVADIIYKGSGESAALKDEYRQLWEKVVGVFESTHDALKNREISVSDYKTVLYSVFEKTLTAKPPQVLDSVIVGDLRRTRTGRVRAVFVMNAVQGEFPKSAFSGAEFTEAETERLCEAGIFIEENRAARYYREKFLINRALTLADEKLFLTASKYDEAWKEKQISSVLYEADLIKKHKNPMSLPASFWASHKNALGFRAAENPSNTALTNALSLVNPDEYYRLFSARGNEHKSYLHKIDADDAEKLMKRGSFSPSRIETLNTCLFKYFCEQGLRISKNDPSDAMTRGNMTHYVLEKALRDYEFQNYERFLSIERGELVKIAENYIAEFEEKEFEFKNRKRTRKKEILLAHAEGLADVLKQIQEDMKLSEFRPRELEKKFEFSLGGLLIKGKIDRIDVHESDNSRYVRVIDYKTGSKEFNEALIKHGLNIQALIYLFAIAGTDGGYEPSGAFYRLVNGGKLSEKCKPYGAAEINSQTDLYINRLETQRTSGLQFGAISPDIEMINNEFKKNASSRKKFIKLVNLEYDEFSKITETTAKQLKERITALYGGDIRAVPVYSGKSPCTYCDYKNICRNAGKYEEVRI